MRESFILALVLTLGGVGQGVAEETAQAIGDPEAGADVWILCSGCHQIGPDAEIGIGPPLSGIFGRRMASVEGFPYSRSMMRMGRDGLIWSLETLDAYIENPRVLVSGTRMGFEGLEDPTERADLLAFLREFSDKPSNIPEAAPTALAALPTLSDETLAIVGDAAYGEYLASECTTCHQRDGSDRGIPSITLWPEENFVLAMHAYKQKLRPHPVMQMMASRLSDEEIAALAAYFATLGR
ncbi:c-type cytochrome [Rhodovulum adriaticum]|uniref:Sulfide dehydrogenase (Flavocytochrome c) cytochrome c subunit n=1 Tax=Rhodovulum adriaticum TaxID=35804 RepID=A0A4R2NN73_RHOAD|nr:c-type cytochrome [Rhodovulum adriaticum]MBK1634452.1 cytochrome C [Rhodovulum adriaticum]TCP23179.1 sulfide dehydrogenase (flavocytochrome c) cytochrome c subunit [Rhodovulum adriaticum]